jgi:hypothetical protein
MMAYLIACSRWAFLTSGFIFLLAMMSVSEAPTIALWNFCVRRVRFFACSSSWPFLCLRLSQVVKTSCNNEKDTFLKYYCLYLLQLYRRVLMVCHALHHTKELWLHTTVRFLPIKNGPRNLPGIPLHQIWRFTFRIQERECLAKKTILIKKL